jgi:ubiquinone/menaquinone biosynthesis C-methylase UbiE
MGRLSHYDVFSWFYDATTEPLHRQHRIDAVELLDLAPGATVLDLPCGTGANFPFLNLAVHRTGRIIGLDASQGMLRHARAKVATAAWEHVTLVEADARTVSPEVLGVERVDAVISMLGFSVIPDWERVFERTYDLLAPGGRYVVMDLYLEGRRTSRMADAFFRVAARADSTRRFWEPLERRVDDFELHDEPCFGGVARTVAGTKPMA